MSKFPKTDSRYWAGKLFKYSRTVNGQIYTDEHWSVRMGYQYRQEQFALGTANKAQAATKARAIYLDLQKGGWGAVRLEYKPKALPKCEATVGNFLEALLLLHASRASTIGAYAGSLRKIAADIAGIESGGRGGNQEAHRIWRTKVEAVKLSLLTPTSIQSWKERFLVRAGTDPVKQRSARVSVNTFLREARSLFSARYIEKLDSILLPNPLPFAGIKLERRSMPRYQSTFNVAVLIQAACNQLAKTEPEQFKVFVLAIMGGLRRNEIDKLEWSRFNWSTGAVTIEPTAVFRTKSEDSVRSVGLPLEMLQLFRGYYAQRQSAFVIESKVVPIMGKAYDHYRCAAIFDALIAWLRLQGLNGLKPLHTLRKEYGSQIAARFGIYAAKEALGHSDISVTAQHYLETKDRPIVALGHLLTSSQD
jgi:integrase